MRDATNYMQKVSSKKLDAKLAIDELACALYEGMPHVQNLAEKTARNYGTDCQALSFFDLMGADIQNFWFGIAEQIINHSKEWEKNNGSACVLSKKEQERLKALPRVAVQP
jgi:hypothetical protein